MLSPKCKKKSLQASFESPLAALVSEREVEVASAREEEERARERLRRLLETGRHRSVDRWLRTRE